MIQAKSICLIALIDDIYDVIDRWDLTAMDKLPEYMKLCFFALFNMVHEEGYWVMKEKGLDIVPGLKKEWGNYAKHTLRKQNGSTMDKLPSSKSTWRMVGYQSLIRSCYLMLTAWAKT
ncbi:terpene synthase 10-like [Zingiber officinale]|uniref:terpene synthase 10-like n=1 Tax=Zingiber officinale TaxID=94328 RepID=UPI001C4AD931|nr:terpene synthase 10-like [Zingiber officinale]